MTQVWSSVLGATLALSFGGCIKRIAPPPSTAAAPPVATANAANAPLPTLSSGRSASQEAASARLASVPRTDLLAGGGIAAFKLEGETKKVVATKVAVSGQPFTEATRYDIKEGSGHEWAVQLLTPNASPIASGDALLATFWLRTEAAPEGAAAGQTEFVFELGQAPYTKVIQYPVVAGPEWTKISVRFQANRAFAAGEAHAIFRLGYEPEIIEIAAVQVENFAKQVAVGVLPSSQGIDRQRDKAAGVIGARSASSATSAPIEGGDFRFEIDAGKVIRPISPYVYGINSQKDDGVGTTLRRMGGNRQTAYNWENNASNAGSDYHHQSDEWPCSVLGLSHCSEAAGQFTDFAAGNKAAGIESMAVIPMVDYVTADKNGPVSEADKAPSKRWKHSYPQKKGAYSLTPDLKDDDVYQDEFVNALVQKLGRADKGGIKFYALDNEPALWPSTHPRIHPEKTTYREILTRTEALASAMNKLDPSAVILGGTMFGWSEFMSLSEAPDAAEHNAQYGSYLDFYLASLKNLEKKHGKRLVQGLDIHWYPETKGTKRTTEDDVSPKTVAARLQTPRSLWDPTFTEKSWIGDQWGKPIRLIPWMLERIAQRYPGTKLGMTEYNFGAGEHVSGGLAQADALGIFGREGLYLANYWGNGPGNEKLQKYIKAAFRLYRNFDGKGGTYGDTAVVAAPVDIAKASVYAATDSKHPGALTVVVLNKEVRTTWNGKLALQNSTCKQARVFSFDGNSSDIRAAGEVEVKAGLIEYRLPPLSATLFVCAAN